MKKITMTLDTASINRAIKDIQSYKLELKRKFEQLMTTLIDRGVEIAKVQVSELGAVYTGELMGSVSGYYSPGLQSGFIYAGAPYAIYVEYGVGVVGKRSPHPEPKEWAYDINNHGEVGWWYYDERESRWRWTRGTMARPFMYNTARELESEVARIAREVFGR